jgi:tRNA(Ile)-lysidine synthase
MNTKSNDIWKKLLQIFSHDDILNHDDAAIAVGVSGGPDSMALIALLSKILSEKRNECVIHALIVNHNLRDGAEQEAESVKKWLSSWSNVKPEILHRDITDEQKNVRIQENARADRYKLISEYCDTHNINKLYLAHHIDDQAETFLFRLAKGSGLDGLSAMTLLSEYSDTLQIVRPLLSIQKEELVEYCNENQIPYVSDPSNFNQQFARPRLRHARDVLEKEGLTSKRLFLTAQRLNRAKKALDYYAESVLSRSIIDEEMSEISLDFKSIQSEPEEIRLRVVRLCIKKMTPLSQPYGPRMDRVESLSEDIFCNTEFKTRTLGGLVFKMIEREKKLKIYRE